MIDGGKEVVCALAIEEERHLSRVPKWFDVARVAQLALHHAFTVRLGDVIVSEMRQRCEGVSRGSHRGEEGECGKEGRVEGVIRQDSKHKE